MPDRAIRIGQSIQLGRQIPSDILHPVVVISLADPDKPGDPDLLHPLDRNVDFRKINKFQIAPPLSPHSAAGSSVLSRRIFCACAAHVYTVPFILSAHFILVSMAQKSNQSGSLFRFNLKHFRREADGLFLLRVRIRVERQMPLKICGCKQRTDLDKTIGSPNQNCTQYGPS